LRFVFNVFNLIQHKYLIKKRYSQLLIILLKKYYDRKNIKFKDKILNPYSL
jgi:hypothetical protein